MKELLFVLLVLFVVFLFAGCGADDRRQADPSAVQSAQVEQSKKVQITQAQLDAQYKGNAGSTYIDPMVGYTNCQVVPGMTVSNEGRQDPVYMCDSTETHYDEGE